MASAGDVVTGHNAASCMVDSRGSAVLTGGTAAAAQWVIAAGGLEERDAFISWLRGEFAAANAIIDALCQHLQAVGSPSEYDFALACIHQRRYNWNPVLHMQQYYSIAEVLFSLQQVTYRKLTGTTSSHEESKDLKDDLDHGSGVNGSVINNSMLEDQSKVSQELDESSGDSNVDEEHGTEVPPVSANGGGSSAKRFPDSSKKATSEDGLPAPKHIDGFEEIDGKQVNLLEGLEVQENVFDAKESSRIASLVSESHAGKKKCKAGGSKRSSKVKAKEVIHFGTIPSDILAGQTASPSEQQQPAPVVTEETAEPMPAFLESIIDRLVKSQIVPASKRPDSCSITVLEPGDYMPPHRHNSFEQPLFVLALGSQSELTFGRNLKRNSTGEADGKYKLVLPVGSVLVLQGNSAQMVECAVSPLQTTRMLVTFGKMAVKKSFKTPTSPVPSSSSSPLSPTALNGHAFVPVRGYQSSAPPAMVLPVRTAGQVHPTQPMIVATIGPYSPAVTVVGPGWPPTTTPPPGITRVPSPGTGVFLPAKGTIVYSNNPHQQMNGSHRRYAHHHHQHHQQQHHHFENATTSNGHVIAEKEVAA